MTVATQHGLLLPFVMHFNTFMQTCLYGKLFLCICATKYFKYANLQLYLLTSIFLISGTFIQDYLKSWDFYPVSVGFSIFFLEVNFNWQTYAVSCAIN